MDDLISRRSAIDAIMCEPTDAHYPSWYAERLEQLPSAQPVAKDINVPVKDCISRQAAIDALGERPMVWVGSDYELGSRNQYDADVLALETVPSAQPVLTYQTCSDALLKMWMDNVLTDGEYNRIMDKLNAWKGVQT